MISKEKLNEMKDNIFEGKYNGKTLSPLINTLSKTYDDREKTKMYIKINNLKNTTPGRAFATAEQHFEKALYFYMQAKNLMDKLR